MLHKAYREACAEGTVEIFNTRLNLIGHKNARKTSLLRALTGKTFKERLESTEGISVHLIESTFTNNKVKATKWNQIKNNTGTILKESKIKFC